MLQEQQCQSLWDQYVANIFFWRGTNIVTKLMEELENKLGVVEECFFRLSMIKYIEQSGMFRWDYNPQIKKAVIAIVGIPTINLG